jgi:purine-nucleoside phosphorylase
MTDHRVARLVDIVAKRGGPIDKPVGIILGSGLGELADGVTDARVISYGDLPGFPKPGVTGHAGRLVLGRIGNHDVAVLQGRAHYYEEGEIFAMKAPLETLHAIGCETLLLTNAAGSLRDAAGPGSVMLIRDHINLAGVSPLFGEAGTQRFVDMVDAYDPDYCQRFMDIATREKITLHEGVYAYFCGPNFETPAEVRAAKILGADLVGMSTAPEVIMARFLGIRVAAMSIVTNYAAGTDSEPLSHEHTMRNAALALEDVKRLVTYFLTDA